MRPLLIPLALCAAAAAAGAQDNFLILVADDLGIDQLASYGLGSDLPPTPTLDALAANGVLFRNAYSSPVCSPSRAQLLTGRHAFRTGIGHIVGPEMIAPELFQLPLDELTLPEMLDQGTGGLYANAAIGKWHLYYGPDFATAPNVAGFDHFAGTPANLGFDPSGYFDWVKIVDGTFFVVLDTYVTSDQVDEALAFLDTAPEPWLCYVAFSAAHVPFHEPPADLHTQDLSGAGPPSVDPRPYYKATVEALDTEIGRLLSGIGPLLPRTNVFFVGDNGTPFEVVVPPFDPDHAKTTLYDGGCRVPFIVAGPAVLQPGAKCDALVGLTDIYATLAELAAVSLPDVLPAGTLLDSQSLVPYLQAPATKSRRATVFAQLFAPLGSAPYNFEATMMRDERYKLLRIFTPGVAGFPELFFDLLSDPFEQQDLLAAGLTPAQLDAYRGLDRATRDLLRPAQLSGPAGSETHVVLGTNTNASGGRASSLSYRVASQTGVAAHGAVSSSTRRAKPGSTWLTGGIASAHPVVFGFGDARGQKGGGDVRSLFGYDLGQLATSVALDLKLGGQDVSNLTVLSDTHAVLTTPPGLSQFGNPAGVETLWLRTDAGQVLQQRAFAYLPAIDVSHPVRVGGIFRLRMAASPGDLFQVAWGTAIPGLALPVPPLDGAFELLGTAHALTLAAVTASGEELIHVPVPDMPSMIGLPLDLQGLAAPLGDLAAGGFTNRVRVVFAPPMGG
jgi:arylsulfatase A-like enzyme